MMVTAPSLFIIHALNGPVARLSCSSDDVATGLFVTEDDDCQIRDTISLYLGEPLLTRRLDY